MAGNYERMIEYYPLLVESSLEFKIESKKLLAKNNGKFVTDFTNFKCNIGTEYTFKPEYE